jgi:hypothetical protein
MTAVLIAAIGLFALRFLDWFRTDLLLLAPASLFGAAIVAAFLRQGRDRVWHAAFGAIGIAYIALTADYSLGDAIRPHLATTHLLSYVHTELADNPFVCEVLGTALYGPADSTVATSRAMTPARRFRRLLFSSYKDHFQRVGHSLLAIAAALVSGSVAARFWANRHPPASSPLPDSPGE